MSRLSSIYQLFLLISLIVHLYCAHPSNNVEVEEHVLAPVINVNSAVKSAGIPTPQLSGIRAKRKVHMCFHSGNCPSRYSCIGFFCVFTGPSEIKRIHNDDPKETNDLKNQ